MSDFELTAYLVDDEHRITVGFDVACTKLGCDLQADEESIVFHDIVSA